jgi:chromosome segregation ATPase
MSDIRSADSYEAASERLERALARLEAGAEVVAVKARKLETLQSETAMLTADKGRLSTELERVRDRTRRLDESAAEVSHRLIEAMETVKAVLAK